MENWLVSMKRADFKAIAARFGIDQVTARLIRNRDVIGDEAIEKYLNGTPDDLYPPHLMKDMDKACDILLEKIRDKKRIRIIGDYDIDGVTSTYILLHSLKSIGADVDERIPERIKDGYGINESLVHEAARDGIDCIITCDNGISAAEQIKIAKEAGITVIVTDHHEIPYDLQTKRQLMPEADAVVDPKRSDCSYPFDGLCGAAIAWKLVSLLYEKAGACARQTEKLLKFAAMATICDVCDLKDENRIIVKYGLKQLSQTKHIGLKALAELCGLKLSDITPYHIGFVIGPCLNASGRLDTAQKALALLMSENKEEAFLLASELVNMNNVRKDMTEEYFKKACERIETSELKNDKVLVVYLPDCHESIAGIIAARIREAYDRPAFILTDAAKGVKGSGRSIDEYSMYDELIKCGFLLDKFGGHPKASGLSLKKENIEPLKKALNENTTLTEDDLMRKIHIDMPLPLGYITERLVEDMEKLSPFGQGNPRPHFVQKRLKVLYPTAAGKKGNSVKMRLADESGVRIDAIYFGDAKEFLSNVSDKEEIAAVFYPTINTYMGRSSLQLVLKNYR